MKHILLLLSCFSLFADEGMWLFNALPTQKIAQKYGVELSPQWIEHVQKSALRISAGGSGSFVSEQGLIITNHHVGSQAVYALSKAGRDFMKEGFFSHSLEEEIPCPNFYVDQLISIRDVTEQVNAHLTEEMTGALREEARNQAIIAIKNQAKEETGLQPEIVTLYEGARYHLYLYQRYSDIRLVMAPEKSIAFFGGDPDNFEYPRYDLDICFFRAYQDGKPLTTPNYLRFSETGPEMGKVLFVAGNPGKTRRMLTYAHLRFLQEMDLPLMQKWMVERRQDFLAFSAESPENVRIAEQDIFSFENNIKVYNALIDGLAHTDLLDKKLSQEKELEKNHSPKPWTDIENALNGAKVYYRQYLVLEGAGSYYSKLYSWAKQLVRYAAEQKLPNSERLKEYADSELPALQLSLFSEEPLYLSLEKVRLKRSFERTTAILGKKHPVSKLLRKQKIDALIAHTQLNDLAIRKDLYEHPEKIETSTDPFIRLARAIDPYARKIRKHKEAELDSPLKDSYTQIAQILFQRYGESAYPDATFTLRLSYGAMEGYKLNGVEIPPYTTFAGLFQHAKEHDFKSPYDLPHSWLSQEKNLPLSTPFDFVSTNDIIGGNSGSPVINADGQFVGIIFDGNAQSMLWTFGYDDAQGRAVSVHSRGILEALRDVYHAEALLKELLP